MQIFDSYIEAGQELNLKDKREYYTALIEFIYYGVEPNLKGAAKAIFTAIRPSLELSKQRSEQGKKGAAKTNLAGRQNGDLPGGKTEISGSSNSNSNSKSNKEGIAKAIPEKNAQTIAEVIDYLNAKLGTRYKATSAQASKHINARINEGYTLDDFKAVIDKKHAQWKDDPNMAKFLRPETLFGTKFDGYLNEPVSEKEAKADEIFSGIGELW